MQIQPIVTFHGMPPSEALEADVRARIAKLGTTYSSILGCRVGVELAHRHHASGNRFHVRVDLTVPGEEIVVTHATDLHPTAQVADAPRRTKGREVHGERTDAHVAVHEAFDIAKRRLREHARRQRGHVKTAERPPRGRVARLFPFGAYGYLEAEDGHEVYFQKSSVLNGGFDRLDVGSTVSYVEEPGDEGPQASTVRLCRQPRRQGRTPERV